MNSEENTSATISRNDINNFPFPYKLWIAVNSVTCEFIKWNIDGTQIELQLNALDNYLGRSQSIFKIKSRSSFITHLRGFGFQLVKTETEKSHMHGKTSQENACASSYPASDYNEIVMHFNHMHFLRHRIDLLANIRKINDSIPSIVEEKQTPWMGNRSEDDLCFRQFGSHSPLFKAQFKHQLILNFISETKTLEKKLQASDVKSKDKGHQGDEEDSMIELPAELFENPHDSVMFMADEYRSAYAGFYGNCTNEQVLKFFGPYLPMYENDNNEEGEQRIANLNPTGKEGPSLPNSFELNISLNEEPTIQSEDITQQQNVPISTAASSLQPIFIPDEKEKDEDILMDEFIKFKEQTENQELAESNGQSKVKIEDSIGKENAENDANFKIFFSQYRESLNLLYEKQ